MKKFLIGVCLGLGICLAGCVATEQPQAASEKTIKVIEEGEIGTRYRYYMIIKDKETGYRYLVVTGTSGGTAITRLDDKE